MSNTANIDALVADRQNQIGRDLAEFEAKEAAYKAAQVCLAQVLVDMESLKGQLRGHTHDEQLATIYHQPHWDRTMGVIHWNADDEIVALAFNNYVGARRRECDTHIYKAY